MKKTKKSGSNKIYFKIGFILILILLLMIPNTMLTSLIWERQSRKNTVINEIANSWGDKQTVAGPVITIPYEYITTNSDGISVVNNDIVYLLPEQLDIKTNITPTPRKRSIYTALLYKSEIQATGTFYIPDIKEIISHDNATIDWSKANLSIGISDVQAMDSPIKLKVDGNDIEMEPGTANYFLSSSGVQAIVELNDETKEIIFSFDLDIKGNEVLFFEPIGKNTTVKMTSSWESPSFIGKILPEKHQIDKNGFTANWKANKYNRSYPQSWIGSKYRISSNNTNYDYGAKVRPSGSASNNSFGVRLVEPVNHYLKNTRAAKYAILIIGLSFGIFFFFEMLKKNKIHAIQYIMVGFALSLFYFLLLSITEHLGFDSAYLISSVATVLLITTYAANILKYGKSILVLFIALSLLYGYIFIILQLEDYALLAGSIGLFVILGLTMFLSRNVNWYAIQEEADPEEVIYE